MNFCGVWCSLLCVLCFVLSYCGIRLAQVLFTDLCQPQQAREATYPALRRLSREKNFTAAKLDSEVSDQCGRSRLKGRGSAKSIRLLFVLVFIEHWIVLFAPASCTQTAGTGWHGLGTESLSLKFNFWYKIAEEGDKLKTDLIDD